MGWSIVVSVRSPLSQNSGSQSCPKLRDVLFLGARSSMLIHAGIAAGASSSDIVAGNGTVIPSRLATSGIVSMNEVS